MRISPFARLLAALAIIGILFAMLAPVVVQLGA